MTYLVTDKCINCKYGDCIEVCPVNCFHAGENMVVIDQATCIDCGICQIACPANAIIPDTEEGSEKWLEFNHKYAQIWDNVCEAKAPLPNADQWSSVPNKLPYLSQKKEQ